MQRSFNPIILLTTIITLFIANCSSVQTTDCIEKQVFLEQLSIIENFVYKNSLDSSLRRAGAIMFLEMLTHIESESKYSWESKLDPTIKDYTNWKKWFEQNEENLCKDPYRKSIDTTYRYIYQDMIK